MQQNVHHHATHFQQVVQPCMGCGSHNYLKSVPCAWSDCNTMCCDQCIQYPRRVNYGVCNNHFRLIESLKKLMLVLGALMGGVIIFGIFVLG